MCASAQSLTREPFFLPKTRAHILIKTVVRVFFKSFHIRAKQLLVDFTATWCGPCKMIGPYFEELAAKFPDVEFVKVDVDELDDVAAACGISAMPTFQLYSNGVMVKEMCGADKAKLEALANEANDL
jgi:thioredoxin 1